eukprot:scaffold49935_cov19-Prasinocladus_malaysianus.AAC.2
MHVSDIPCITELVELRSELITGIANDLGRLNVTTDRLTDSCCLRRLKPWDLQGFRVLELLPAYRKECGASFFDPGAYRSASFIALTSASFSFGVQSSDGAASYGMVILQFESVGIVTRVRSHLQVSRRAQMAHLAKIVGKRYGYDY